MLIFLLSQRNAKGTLYFALQIIKNIIIFFVFANKLMSSYKNIIAIHFSVYCQTSYGQQVCIVGNCPQLGLWDDKKGLKLQTNPRQYPIWFSKNPITLAKLTNLQYKLCILDKDGIIIKWENLKQNRSLSLKTSCSIFFTEGEPEVEYDFDGSDANSTQLNSTRKTHLSQIEQESDDDQPVLSRRQTKQESSADQRRRSGSSKGRNWINMQEDACFDNGLTKFQNIGNL